VVFAIPYCEGLQPMAFTLWQLGNGYSSQSSPIIGFLQTLQIMRKFIITYWAAQISRDRDLDKPRAGRGAADVHPRGFARLLLILGENVRAETVNARFGYQVDCAPSEARAGQTSP
jgi:hypothetical protein